MHLQRFLLHTAPPTLLTPANFWQAWHWEASILWGLTLAALLYGRGVWQVWQRAGWGHGVSRRQVLCFYSALSVLFVALLSPLAALSALLFSAHMVQHLLLLLLAPLLLVLSRPLVALLWALPPTWRRRLAKRWLRLPWLRRGWQRLSWAPVAWLIHMLILWGWHMPLLYQAALHHASVHRLEHLAFLGAAWLLWWTVIEPVGGQARYGVSILAIFLTALQGGILGALLTFSTALWYPLYAPLTARWGLTPLADQQLAGVIMWVPAGIIYLLAAAGLFVAWLAAVERKMRQREYTTNPVAAPSMAGGIIP